MRCKTCLSVVALAIVFVFMRIINRLTSHTLNPNGVDLLRVIWSNFETAVGLCANGHNSSFNLTSISTVLMWISCACVAPLLYCPAVQIVKTTDSRPPRKVPVAVTKKRRTRKVPKSKNKYTETTGSRNKKVRAEAIQYLVTRERIQREKMKMLRRIRHVVLSYWARCHRHEVRLQSLSYLTSQSPRSQVSRLQRELVVVENTVVTMKNRLQSLQWQNKQAVQSYEMIHQLMLGLTGQ